MREDEGAMGKLCDLIRCTGGVGLSSDIQRERPVGLVAFGEPLLFHGFHHFLRALRRAGVGEASTRVAPATLRYFGVPLRLEDFSLRTTVALGLTGGVLIFLYKKNTKPTARATPATDPNIARSRKTLA